MAAIEIHMCWEWVSSQKSPSSQFGLAQRLPSFLTVASFTAPLCLLHIPFTAGKSSYAVHFASYLDIAAECQCVDSRPAWLLFEPWPLYGHIRFNTFVQSVNNQLLNGSLSRPHTVECRLGRSFSQHTIHLPSIIEHHPWQPLDINEGCHLWNEPTWYHSGQPREWGEEATCIFSCNPSLIAYFTQYLWGAHT